MKRFTADDGVGIAYHSFPSESPRPGLPVVVLQHGFAVNTDVNWVRTGVVAALNAGGRSVLSVDARGHGESDKPHDSAFYGEGRMSKDLVEMFDHLGLESLDLVGYSMGGVISVITASAESRVRRLVVGGIGAGVVELGGVDTRAMDRSALAKALRAEDRGTVTDPNLKAFRAVAEWAGADLLALAAQSDVVHHTPIKLGSITATTLVLVGDKDPLAARPEVLVSAIPGAQLHLVPGDHLGAVGSPEFAPAIVDFLNQT